MSSTRFQMVVRRVVKPLGAVALLVAMVMYSTHACSRKIAPGKVPARPEPSPQGWTTHVVHRVTLPGRAEVPGTVASVTLVQIRAKIPAHVQRVLVSAGSVVTASQELVVLDDREIAEQLAAAEAQLRQAEAEYRRTRGLFETRATTEQMLLAAETARDAARAQVDRIRVMLSYTRVVSPLTGVVTDRRVEEGDLVSPGQALLSVYDPTQMRLEANVPVRLVSRIHVGEVLDVVLPDLGEVRKGTVQEIVSEIDPATRTQTVKVRLDNPQGLRPGAFGRLRVLTDPVDTMWIPERAVQRVGQLELVRVWASEGRLLQRLIRTGRRENREVEVHAGLDDGELLAVPAGGS